MVSVQIRPPNLINLGYVGVIANLMQKISEQPKVSSCIKVG